MRHPVCRARTHHASANRRSFSKKSRGEWDHWVEGDGKKAAAQGDNFRNHPARNFFKTVKPSIMPGLNEAMTK